MKSRRIFFLFLVVVGLIGCSQNPSEISSSTASEMVNYLTYAKDARTKLCYATVASRHTGQMSQNGFTITYVPCTPEVEAQIRNH